VSPEKTLQVNSARFFRKGKYGLDKFILIGKQKIHYVEAGQGDPIIMIPGSSSTYRAWARLMPLLAGDHRLLALDYPLIPSSSSEQTGDLKAVMEWSETIIKIFKQLKLSKVNLIGWGFGGAVAFDLAARFADTVDKIVTVSWYITGAEEAKPSSRLDWKKWGLKRNSRAGLMDEAKNIKQPVLYLYGTGPANQSSMATNLQFLQTHLPQTWIIGLEGGIFELLLNNPQEVASLITKFLRTKLEPSR
jgi:pimeloyl-ACP methyl ester carboxylesterase